MTIPVNIKLDFKQLIEIVKQLSPKEKILLNDALWSENSEIPLEHQALVTERIDKAKENPDRLLDWDEASKTLKG